MQQCSEAVWLSLSAGKYASNLVSQFKFNLRGTPSPLDWEAGRRQS
jgi:hypothetical protein